MLRAARFTLQGIGLFTIIAAVAGIIVFFELANLLQYENKPAKADFIFPLVGNVQRLEKAAQLYNKRFASKILLSNEIGRLAQTVAQSSNMQSDLSALQLNTLAAAGVESQGSHPIWRKPCVNGGGGRSATDILKRPLSDNTARYIAL